MPVPESHFGVWLNRDFVGLLRQRGAAVTFALHPEYAHSSARPVLGLLFEQDLTHVHRAIVRLPAWFSNLLPEGPLRKWVAQEVGVPSGQEVPLLARIGRDLPGAVTVMSLPVGAVGDAGDEGPDVPVADVETGADEARDPRGRFSLAGVQMKLSMVAVEDRLTVPMGGALGDWIVKFPDATFPDLPVVEHATMALAKSVGLDVPEIRLATRGQLPDTPDAVWRSREEAAYAIRRFDRRDGHGLVHMEDFAQVFDVYPEARYDGSYERLAALVHRGEDTESLRELTRRIIFNLMVDNSDAHLKNWSLLYRNPRRPTLSPAYDLVSIAPYAGYGERLSLSLGGLSDPREIRLRHVDRLGVRPGLAVGELEGLAEEIVVDVVAAWPAVRDQHLGQYGAAAEKIEAVITARASSLRAR